MHGLSMTPVTLFTGPRLHTHPEELPGITPTLQAGHEVPGVRWISGIGPLSVPLATGVGVCPYLRRSTEGCMSACPASGVLPNTMRAWRDGVIVG